jgi:hypothetical protein
MLRKTKPLAKPPKLGDSGGLQLLINRTAPGYRGSKFCLRGPKSEKQIHQRGNASHPER